LRGGKRLKGQLHIHTTASDGRLTPQEAADLYSSLGFGFIAYTDHDHLLKPNYPEMIAAVKTELLVFSGIEHTVGTRWGYVHVNQIDGEQEKLFVFNHPADYGLSVKQVREAMEDVSQKYPIAAVEITHMGFYTPDFDTELLPYPKLATDDSHNSLACGRTWIELDCIRDKDEIIRQIKCGNFHCGYTRGSKNNIRTG
jgi:hypothetical protein